MANSHCAALHSIVISYLFATSTKSPCKRYMPNVYLPMRAMRLVVRHFEHRTSRSHVVVYIATIEAKPPSSRCPYAAKYTRAGMYLKK